MASILDRYGIKEVADLTFYELNDDGTVGAPVLYIDTAKVSTIEQTAESVEARGGKGNPALVSWDFGKEITVTIEDALFSPKSLAIMFGNGKASEPTDQNIKRVAVIRTDAGDTAHVKAAKPYFVSDIYDQTQGSIRTKLNFATGAVPAGQVRLANQILYAASTDSTAEKAALYDEDGTKVAEISQASDLNALAAGSIEYSSEGSGLEKVKPGHKLMLNYWLKSTATMITVSGDTFPGTYYVTGDTYARSDVSGKDQFFQFIIHKAKMQSENTITLEAEGDPSTFNMSLQVLRDEDGAMIDLVQYDLVG